MAGNGGERERAGSALCLATAVATVVTRLPPIEKSG